MQGKQILLVACLPKKNTFKKKHFKELLSFKRMHFIYLYMITVAYSSQDIAGKNIVMQLKKIKKFKEVNNKFQGTPILKYKDIQIIKTKEKQVFADSVNQVKTDYLVFASTHTSKTGNPALTVHPIGNWGKALLGGKNFELVKTSGQLLKIALNKLKKNKEKREELKKFEVSLEATHHGPWLEKPTIFIELGGSITQWKNKTAAKTIAETILELKEFRPDKKIKTSIGLGGKHYCSEFNKVMFKNNKRAISHICPKYMLDCFNQKMFEKALNADKEKVYSFVIEHKGMGKEKKRILGLLKKNNARIEKASDLK